MPQWYAILFFHILPFIYYRACGMNGEWGWMGIKFHPFIRMGMNGDEWIALGYYSSPFIHIHPHSYPYVTVVQKPYHPIIGCIIHHTISLGWVTATFHVFNLVDTFWQIPTNVDEWGWMWMNGDEWGWMDRTRILFIPIHPHSDEWVKFNPHSSPFPIHPTCPV